MSETIPKFKLIGSIDELLPIIQYSLVFSPAVFPIVVKKLSIPTANGNYYLNRYPKYSDVPVISKDSFFNIIKNIIQKDIFYVFDSLGDAKNASFMYDSHKNEWIRTTNIYFSTIPKNSHTENTAAQPAETLGYCKDNGTLYIFDNRSYCRFPVLYFILRELTSISIISQKKEITPIGLKTVLAVLCNYYNLPTPIITPERAQQIIEYAKKIHARDNIKIYSPEVTTDFFNLIFPKTKKELNKKSLIKLTNLINYPSILNSQNIAEIEMDTFDDIKPYIHHIFISFGRIIIYHTGDAFKARITETFKRADIDSELEFVQYFGG